MVAVLPWPGVQPPEPFVPRACSTTGSSQSGSATVCSQLLTIQLLAKPTQACRKSTLVRTCACLPVNSTRPRLPPSQNPSAQLSVISGRCLLVMLVESVRIKKLVSSPASTRHYDNGQPLSTAKNTKQASPWGHALRLKAQLNGSQVTQPLQSNLGSDNRGVVGMRGSVRWESRGASHTEHTLQWQGMQMALQHTPEQCQLCPLACALQSKKGNSPCAGSIATPAVNGWQPWCSQQQAYMCSAAAPALS